MAGVYKKKNCPTCGVEHRKRGQFCGQSCANSRPLSDEVKDQRRDARYDYYKTPEGLASIAMLARKNQKRAEDLEKEKKGEYILQDEDYYVEIPDLDSDGTENIKW